MAALLALLSSAVWGTADFAGGTLARRLHPVAVAGVGQAIVLPVLAATVLALGAGHDPGGWLVWGVVAGVVGPIALVSFFEALSTGTMGVVAPVAGTGVIVPVAIGLVQGERPHVLQLFGMALAVAGIVLASGPELKGAGGVPSPGARRSLSLALMAAAGFGTVLYAVGRGSQASVGMTLLSSRVVEVALLGVVALVARSSGGVRARDVPLLGSMSALDVVANGLYALSTRRGLVAIVSVLASQYPVVTVVLARFVHGERLRIVQRAGVVAALAGVALVAAT